MISLLINLYVMFVDESEINTQRIQCVFPFIDETYEHMQVRNASSQTKCQTTSVCLCD